MRKQVTEFEVLGPRGEVISSSRNGRATSLSHYKGADKGRQFGDWPVSRRDADGTFLPERLDLIFRVQERLRNDPTLRGALKKKRDNVIGKGIRVESELDADELGISEDQARELEQSIDREVERGFQEIDYSGNQASRHDFYELQGLLYDTEQAAGENVPLPRYIERPGYRYSFCLQVPDPLRILTPGTLGGIASLFGSNSIKLPNGNEVRDGVEIGPRGELVAIYVADQHPGNMFSGGYTGAFTRIESTNSVGEANFWHIYQKYRPEATRGEPVFVACLAGLRQLGDYIASEVTRADMAAMLGLLIQQSMTHTSEDDFLDDIDKLGSASEREKRQFGMSPGMIQYLEPGESATVVNPGIPGPQFDQFVERIATILGNPIGLTRELMLNTFDKSNFSNTRLALEEARRGFRAEQERFGKRYILPVRERIIHEAWLRGYLNLPRYRTNREAYLRNRLLPPAWPYMEPVKDMQAVLLRYAAGVSTQSEECAALGKDFRAVNKQQAKEMNERKALGLPSLFVEAKDLINAGAVAEAQQQAQQEREAA